MSYRLLLAPWNRLNSRSLARTLVFFVLLLVAGCPHYQAGLPPSLRTYRGAHDAGPSSISTAQHSSNISIVARVPPSQQQAANVEGQPKTVLEDAGAVLSWPVKGTVVSHFGVKDGVARNGIEIQAEDGATVRAAADGKVGYAGSITGLGKVLLIEHPDRFVTVYAHLKDLAVQGGSVIKKGEPVGTLGGTGPGNLGRLYFEVRSRSKPVDPIPLLETGTN